MLSSYRSVLSKPGAAGLFATALVARLPQGMAPLAVLLLVRGATHSYAAAGLAVGAQAFATAAGAPVLGRLVDRFGRLRVLGPAVVCEATMYALLVVAAEAHGGAVVLIVTAGLAGAFMPPVAPVVRAMLGEVFDDPAVRERAYSLDAVTQEVLWTTGPLFVAVMIAVSSPEVAVLVIAAIGLAGATLFLRSRLVRSARAATEHTSRGSALASPELRALLGPVALTGMGLGAIEVGLPSLAIHAGSRPASGVLLALWSVGSMVGGLWYGSRTWQSSLTHRYRVLLGLAVLCTLPLIAARSIPAGLVCSLLAGVTIAPVFACQYALVGRAVSAGTETEAFTWVSAALIGGLAAGEAIGGAVIAPAGVGAPFAISCLATLFAALLAFGFRVPTRRPAQGAMAASDRRPA
jgi:MFS family permease